MNWENVIVGFLAGLGVIHIIHCWINPLIPKDNELSWTCDEPHCQFYFRVTSDDLENGCTHKAFDSVVRSHIYNHAITNKKDYL